MLKAIQTVEKSTCMETAIYSLHFTMTNGGGDWELGVLKVSLYI